MGGINTGPLRDSSPAGPIGESTGKLLHGDHLSYALHHHLVNITALQDLRVDRIKNIAYIQ